MTNGTRRKLAVACYALGTAGLGVSLGAGLALIKLRDQLLKERDTLLREMEDWKAETQAEMFQAIADQQARGVLDFKGEDESSSGSVTPIRRRDVGR